MDDHVTRPTAPAATHAADETQLAREVDSLIHELGVEPVVMEVEAASDEPAEEHVPTHDLSAAMDEVRTLTEMLNADRDRVVLMPEGIDRDRLRERGRWIAEICKQEGFRFSPRLHVDLWGDMRGV